MPNGARYLHLYCERWKIATDKDIGEVIGAEGFRSTERWTLVALHPNGDILATIPGCQVKGLAMSSVPPQALDAQCYNFTTGRGLV